jgi:TDG/mug DNA glycosylase family protein
MGRSRKKPEVPWKPTRAQLAAAAVSGRVPDTIGPDLRVLFVGINPGLYSGAVGRHFARPGNRFWPALAAGGFTDGILSPFLSDQLLERGYGITNLVERSTNAAHELTAAELIAGAGILRRKVRRYRPAYVAIVGIMAYRIAFERPKAQLGRQEEGIGDAVVWVLPNPSGLNAHFRPAELGELFAELRHAADAKRSEPEA